MSQSASNTSVDREFTNIGPNDVMVLFPEGRHPKLPNIFIMESHPKHVGAGTAYYFVHDGSFEAAKEIYELEVNELKIPQGPREDAIARGLLELYPGDILFSRLTTDPASGVEDVAVAWITGRGLFSQQLITQALQTRDTVLGKRELRTRSHAIPDPVTGVLSGGTNWERSLTGKFNPKRGRCYPLGCSFQRQRSIYSPCAAGKLSVADEETLKMRSELAEVSLKMAMMSLKQGPASIVDAIRLNHELYNTPRVGNTENFAFSSNQLNLAHVREWDSDESLADNMGQKFGGAHIDHLDSPGHYTNMISLSDLPPGCDPGRFFIVYPGVFCTLHNFVAVNFSGLRVHGGSPPIASKDSTEEENVWLARCMVVGYAKIGPTTADHKLPLFEFEPNSILSVTPEMMRPGKFSLVPKINATNFVVEGPSLLTPSDLMVFIPRCLLLLVLSLLSKLPSSMGVKLDSDAFLGSFSYLDEHGVRRQAGSWYNGPGWRRHGPGREISEVDDAGLVNQDKHLEIQRKKWADHENKHGGHIPSAVCCLPNIKPLQGWAEGDALEKIKPLLFNKGKPKANDEETPPPSPKPKPRKARKTKGDKKKSGRKSKKTKPDSDGGSDPGPESEEPVDIPSLMLEGLLAPGKGEPSKAAMSSLTASTALSLKPPSRLSAVSKANSHTSNMPARTEPQNGRPLAPQSGSRSLRSRTTVPPPLVSSDIDVLTRAKAQAAARKVPPPLVSSDMDVLKRAKVQAGAQPGRKIEREISSAMHGVSNSTVSTFGASNNMGNVPSSIGDDIPHARSLSDIFGAYVMRRNDNLALDGDPSASFVDDIQKGNNGMPHNSGDTLSDLGDSLSTGVYPPPLDLYGMLKRMSVDSDSPKDISGLSKDSSSVRELLGKRRRSEDTDCLHEIPSPQTASDNESEAMNPVRSHKRRHMSTEVRGGPSAVASTQNSLSPSCGSASADSAAEIHPLKWDDIWNSSRHEQVQIEVIECKLQYSIPVYDEEPEDIYDDLDPLEPSDMPLHEELNNLKELPRFLHGITSEIVSKELCRVRNDVTALSEHRSTASLSQAVNALDAYQKTITSCGPLSPDSASAIQHAWTGLQYLEVSTQKATLRVRQLRSCIMTMNSSLWHWLEIIVPNTVASLVFDDPEVECPWLGSLIQTIGRQAREKPDEFSFFPFHYGLNDLQPAHAAVIGFGEIRVPREDDVLAWIRFYCSIIREILEVWLEFPTSGKERWKGAYALNIIQTLGPDFLLLDVVWEKYQSASVHLVKNVSLPDELDVSRYPLLEPSSNLRSNVKHLAQLVEDYVRGRLYRYLDFSSQEPTVNFASEALRADCETHVIAFKKFIRDCFRHVFRGEVLENARMQELLEQNPDKFSPFREHAPTRRNMRSTDGPFSSSALRSTEGVFSALVCRGVTFGTRMSRKGRTLFSSPADFHQAVYGLKESDYCDPAAYGQHNTDRVPGLVDLYWEELQSYPWPGLQHDNVMTFKELYRYFCPVSGRNRRFMQLGPLGAYLLTVDYVYAGLVEIPSSDEMARIIMKLNKGPARTLVKLGLVAKTSDATRSAREQEFVDGFVLAERLVKDSIPYDYHKEIGIDVFVTEHSLCKYGRMNSRGGFSE